MGGYFSGLEAELRGVAHLHASEVGVAVAQIQGAALGQAVAHAEPHVPGEVGVVVVLGGFGAGRLDRNLAVGGDEGRAESRADIRITSYNVCYTKLLR